MSDKKPVSINQEQKLKEILHKKSTDSKEVIFKDLNSNIDGLSEAEAAQWLEEYGLNEVQYEKRKPW